MVLCCLRSTLVSDMQGGMSQVMATIIKSIFCRKDYNPVLGLLLPSPEEGVPSLKLFFRFHLLLQDGASHKQTWSSRGEAALKYCILCDVRTPAKDARLDDDEAGVAHFYKYSDMRVFSSDDILASYDRLVTKRQELDKDNFTIWQKAVGLTWSLCCDRELREANLLRPREQFGHDWMHGAVSHGIFQVTVYQLFTSLGSKSWGLFEQYLMHWTLPKRYHMTHLANLFAPKKVKKYKDARKFGCQASEALGMLPILVHWVKQCILRPGNSNHKAACEAFLAVAETQLHLHMFSCLVA